MSIVLENKRNNWGILISSLMHVLLLLVFFSIGIDRLEPQEQREGLLVAIGDFTESSMGQDPLGNTEEVINSSELSTPPISPFLESKAKENTLTSDVGQPIKTTINKKEVSKLNPKIDAKPIVKSSDKPESSSSQNTNKEYLDKKKQQFGSLFGKGQGSKEGNGSQGDPGGSPDSKILEGISKGRGTVGGGLNGRKVMQAPTISENSQKYGKVSIKVCVDKNGKVVTANFTQKGSNTTDAQLVRIAEKGAMKYVFAPGELDSQCGTITFDFKLN